MQNPSRESLLTQESTSHSLLDVTIPSSTSISNKASARRILSLDIYRGLTMVGMILVDNQYEAPWYLDHPLWDGLTPADFIFPAFLFILGMAVPLAISHKRPVRPSNLLRVIGLFLIGVFLNLSSRKFTFNHFRIPGILQRASLCYAITLAIHYLTNYGAVGRRKIGWVIVTGFMLIYTLAMLLWSHPDPIRCPHSQPQMLSPECNLSGYIDTSVFTNMHMINPTDPQGLLSTLPAATTSFLGYQCSLLLKDYQYQPLKAVRLWLIGAIICGIITYPLTYLMPFNKKIYSVSFLAVSSAVSAASLSLFYMVLDYWRFERVAKILSPLKWLGMNPLAIFVLMIGLTIIMLRWIFIDGQTLLTWYYLNAYSSWIPNSDIASIVFSLSFLLLWTIVAGIMYSRKLFIKL